MVLQIRHPIRRAAAGVFVSLSLAGSAFSQEGCVTAAAAPVVDTVQELRDYVGSIWHASDSTRLAVKKAELERRTQRMAREYAEYNAQCESLDRREWAATQGYVPEHPVLNSLFPYHNYRANVEVNVGPNNAAPAPNVLYYNPNTGALFQAPSLSPPNPVRQAAPVQQYVPAQAPTTYAPQQLPTAVANYAPQVNYAPAQYAPAAALPPGYTSASANGGPVNYAPVQYAPFQYGAVPNANANYAPATAPSSQLSTATPVGSAAPAVPPVTQQQFGNGFVPAQAVAPGYGVFQQPAPTNGDPRERTLVVPPTPTNGAF
jgi:hypothetical protein